MHSLMAMISFVQADVTVTASSKLAYVTWLDIKIKRAFEV